MYTSEPVDPDNPVLSIEENIVLTPHLGASTEEAQIKVGTTMAQQLIDFAQKGVVRNAVNMQSAHDGAACRHEAVSVHLREDRQSSTGRSARGRSAR